jgi:hypothetical protein
MTRISATSATRGTLVLAASLALAGCGIAGVHPAASASPSTSNTQILAIGRQYSQCVRDHGVVGFPDPLVNNGQLSLPGPTAGGPNPKQMLQDNPQAQTACQAILDSLPATARQNQQPVTAADLQKLRQFAQCLRQNGIPEWPDPKSDGTFPIRGTALESEGKSPRMIAAMQACSQYWDKGISGS